MERPASIEVEHLRKQYGEQVAVEDVSFEAAGGEVFGLLGPNGAGKSTTIGCLSGLVEPTAGRVRVLGHEVGPGGVEARRELGIVPQELALYEDLSATENLAFWGEAWGLTGKSLAERVRELLARIGLADRAKEPVKRFSGGMKRRLNFGCGIVHRPRVLLLDEPTAGVDPQSRARLVELVREEVGRGACVLYTTHYMEEAEALCDRLAILDRGVVVAQGTMDELRGRIGGRDLVRLSGRFEPDRARAALAALPGIELVHAAEDGLRLAAEHASRRLPELFAALERAGCELRETTVTQPTLETLFLALTGRELRQ